MTSDDDDRRPDSGGSPVGGEPFDWEHFVVPDDARELDADIRAYRREKRAQSRARRLRRLLLWHRLGPAGPVVVGTVLLLVSFVTLMVLFPAPKREVARPDTLATPTRKDGEAGGLVPDVRIRREGANLDQSLRTLRPSVIMLLPRGCDCAERAQRLANAAERHQILTVLVGRSLPELPAAPKGTEVVRGADPTGALTARYHLTDRPALLVVRPDGVINRILTDVPSDNTLDGELVVVGEQQPDR